MDKHNNFTTAITAHGIDPIRSLDLMQVTCPAFNDMTSPSADDHPFLLADSQHANAMPQQIFQVTFTFTAISNSLKSRLTQGGQILNPLGDVKAACTAASETGM